MGNLVSTQSSNGDPWFTHGLEYPKFQTESTSSDPDSYEVRKYEPSKWVYTSIKSFSLKDAAYSTFRPLANFITGANAASTKIPMTCPVAIRVDPSQGPACESSFTTHFYIPKAFQGDTPAPTNPNVKLIEYPAFTAYVISFSGFLNDERTLGHAKKLASLLERDRIDHVKEYYYFCGYDSPYRLFNRHNEVWFIGKQEIPLENQ
jgi:hypothetical protein